MKRSPLTASREFPELIRDFILSVDNFRGGNTEKHGDRLFKKIRYNNNIPRGVTRKHMQRKKEIG